MYFIVALLCFVQTTLAKHVVFPHYTDESEGSLHPRTFYLTDDQENEVIKKVVCEDLDCPQFEVERDHPNFIQQRRYREANFLFSSDRVNCNLTGTLEVALKKLAAYRRGANAREKKYQNTLPVLVQIDQFTTIPSSNPWCHMAFSVGLYTPHYWGVPASPLEASLKFRKVSDGFTVYVDTFTGSITQNLLREIDIFRQNLDKSMLCYKKMRFYLALYDVSSLRPDSRHEIWLQKC